MMTPEQRDLVHDLVCTPPSGQRQISKKAFRRQFPEALEGESLAFPLLTQAWEDKSAEDVQCALIIGFVFDFSPRHEDLLCQLALADWHMSHEDVVSALEKIGATSDKAIDTLYEVTQMLLPYLAYDDYRALAVKAIWALGKTAGTRAEAKLKLLANSSHPILRANAEKQLKRRET
jgi:hypothetical protein